MNDKEKYKEDLLRQYINPESIEKAPEGFTSKVMTHIRMETVPLTAAVRSRKKNLVPVISVAVIILLLVAAFLIPGSQSDSLALPVLNFIKRTKSLLPELNLSSDFRLTLPSVMMYVFIGILVLTLFDRALYGIFHRQK
jgi:hypothetical protein